MGTTFLFPSMTVNATITGVASESTLQSIDGKMDTILEEVSKNIVYPPFYQATNSLTNSYATMLTVGTASVEEISVKQNDGNVLSIAVNGVEKLVCPPSGEVQKYPLKAITGQTIDIKVIGTVSNAGPVEVNFFG